MQLSLQVTRNHVFKIALTAHQKTLVFYGMCFFFLFSLSERARLLKHVRNVFTSRSEYSHANVDLEMNRKLFHIAILLNNSALLLLNVMY